MSKDISTELAKLLITSHPFLKENEKKVLEYRAIHKLTLQRTGEIMGKSRERIRQIQAKGLRKLRGFVMLTKENHEEVREYFRLKSEYRFQRPSELVEFKRRETLYALDLPTRAINALRKDGRYTTVDDLQGVTTAQLMRIRNLGGGTAEKIVNAVRKELNK